MSPARTWQLAENRKRSPWIIHTRSVFTPGQLYGMLSRVTERRLLRLVGPLRPDLFTPVRLPGFVEVDALAEKLRAEQAAAFAAAAAAVLMGPTAATRATATNGYDHCRPGLA